MLPSDLQLLVGVMSYKATVALGRRSAMRSLMQPAAGCALRFVMSISTPDEDAALPDLLLFPVKESSRTLGTYLLNNAFFRYAVALNPRVPFIARADDDSFFDMSTVLAEMLAASSCMASEAATGPVYTARRAGKHSGKHVGRRRFVVVGGAQPDAPNAAARATHCPAGGRAVIYGYFAEWYMWSTRSMQATCFDYGPGRHVMALQRLRAVEGNLTKLPRFQRECLYSDLSGPYPFAKGPLVGYSHSVASTLVSLPELDQDERYALEDRKRTRIGGFTSVLAPPPSALACEIHELRAYGL